MEPWSEVRKNFRVLENSIGVRAATGTPFQSEHNNRFLLLFGEPKGRGILLTKGTIGLPQIDVGVGISQTESQAPATVYVMASNRVI